MLPERGRRPACAHRERGLDGLLIERGDRGLRITRPWSRGAGYAMVFWIVLWSALVAFFTSLAPQPDQELRLMLSLPAIAMAYAALTRFLNSTVIEVDPAGVVLRHTPLPWPGGRRFAARDVAALLVGTRKIHAKGHTVDECWIWIEGPRGKRTMLVKGLEMSELQTSGIAATIGGYLGVTVRSES